MGIKLRILVVDDHVILRDGIVSLLQSRPDFEVVGEAGSVKEAVITARQTNPDLILMDFGLPDGTGLEATRAILAESPDTDIIFLTVHEDDEDLFAAIRSGARGYLLKNIPAVELVDRIRGLSEGKAPISGQMTGRILADFARTSAAPAHNQATLLTARELDVLEEIARGASNQEISNELSVSIYTVKNHIHSILKKLQVRNRRDAVHKAIQRGIMRKRE